MGTATVNILSAAADTGRAIEQCGRFSELGAQRGMAATIEFVPGLPTGNDLQSALEIVRAVGRRDFALMIDTMHLFRTGSTVADLAALDPSMIGYVQLCDSPFRSGYADYAEEARFRRLAPGDGDLPLRDILDVVPRDVTIGLELHLRRKAEAGITPRDRLQAAVCTVRAWLESLPRGGI